MEYLRDDPNWRGCASLYGTKVGGLMTAELLIQILLALVGALGLWILNGMKEEMKSTREQLSNLAQTLASAVQTLDWHQKWLERHDDEIKVMSDKN